MAAHAPVAKKQTHPPHGATFAPHSSPSAPQILNGGSRVLDSLLRGTQPGLGQRQPPDQLADTARQPARSGFSKHAVITAYSAEREKGFEPSTSTLAKLLRGS